MSLVVVGTVALDYIETPFKKRDRLFGGSATFFSFSARFFNNVGLVATVGGDFPESYRRLFNANNIDTEGFRTVKGRTFKWKCRYEHDMNVRHTIFTHLNVFKDFSPDIPKRYRHYKNLFLANIDPDLQHDVMRQMKGPKFVGCDTMNYWIMNKKKSLLRLIKNVDALLLNDSEARQLTEEPNLIKGIQQILKRGPKIVIVKKGEHGSILATKNSLFSVPAYPLESACDPTGAGDAFAGGFLGYLSRCGKINDSALRKSVVHGTVMASFAVESFGPQRLVKLTRGEINSRYKKFQKLTQF